MERPQGTGFERAGAYRAPVSPARRRGRFLRRRPRPDVLDTLMADIARLGDLTEEPMQEADADERALLIQLYRELVATVEGPVVPFPVELLGDPARVAELDRPAELIDLARFRAERAPASPGDQLH